MYPCGSKCFLVVNPLYHTPLDTPSETIAGFLRYIFTGADVDQ